MKLFVFCILLGSILRVFLSTIGHNFDLESYWIVSDLVIQGKSVYQETERYNYGPTWFLILGLLRRFAILFDLNDILSFHIIIATFLTFIDILIATCLKNRFGTLAGIFFFLNPVSILITGFHSQFDNLAILLGYSACCLLLKSDHTNFSNMIIGSVLLGLSLATKHILILFPLWVFWLYRKNSIYQRLCVLLIPYLCFAVICAPYLLESSMRSGFMEHVIRYKSQHGNSLIQSILNLFVNITQLESAINPPLSRIVFLVLLLSSGFFYISKFKQKVNLLTLFFLYLATLTAVTSSMADQYLAIPLITLACYPQVLNSAFYTIAATITLFTSQNNIFGTRFSEMQFIAYPQAQIWLVFFIASLYAQLTKPNPSTARI
jgi:hypothetical protein